MDRLLFFSRDPGGANVIAPVIKCIADKYQTSVYAKDYSVPRLRGEGIDCKELSEELPEITEDSVCGFIKQKSPKAIITGSSLNDFTERYMWKAGEKLGIPAYAIMDQWIHLGIRFSAFDYNGLAEYETHHVFKYVPRRILVMDKLAKQILKEEGIPETKIAVTGQPHFDVVRSSFKNAASNRDNYRSVRVLFASEPKLADNEGTYWGYDEQRIFTCIYETVRKLQGEIGKKIELLIRPHPRENPVEWETIIEKCNVDETGIKVLLDKTADTFSLLKSVDIVCGMSSMLLIEALLCEVPTVSCLIGLKQESPFIFDRLGIYKSCKNMEELYRQMEAIICKGSTPKPELPFIENATGHVINYILEDIGDGSISN